MSPETKEMIERATQVLQHAYAPYSKFKVACCIRSESGELFTGVNVENAAFPLTSCAEACAIGNLILNGQQKIKSVVILNHKATLCPPCGGCRQRIYEFSTPETKIYLCDHEKALKCFAIKDLLPHAFKFAP